MIIKIQVINDSIPDDIKLRIRRRISKLETYYGEIISAKGVFKKDNQSNDKGCHCELRLLIRGAVLFAKEKAVNFEQSASMVIESLRKQLRKKNTVILLQRRTQKMVFHSV